MSVFEINFRSRVRGPIHSGEIHRHASEYEEDVAKAIADEGEEMVLSRLGRVLRHPTGYYESKIDKRQIGEHRWEVHDSGVVYGPWLEGVGSRNSPVTIFPGYRTFRIVEQNLKHKRRGIARKILRAHRARGRLI